MENIEAEQAILGALLMNNAALLLCNGLCAEDFAEPLHGRIYASIREVARDAQASPITLKTRFDGDPALATIGGASYLVKLCGRAGLALDVKALAEEISRLAVRRRIVADCRMAIIQLEDPETRAEEVATMLSTAMQAVSSQTDRLRALPDFEVSAAVADDTRTAAACVSTGLQRLDECMAGGLYQGKAYGFAARKKVGKTILVSTLSANLAERGIKHAVICGEMGAKEVHQRVMARRMNVDPRSFVDDTRHTPAFAKALASSEGWYKGSALYHHAPGITFDELKDIVSADVRIHGIKGYILDYWQLVKGKGSKTNTSEHLDEVAQWIADSCRRYGIWAVVTAQINQEGNTRGGEGLRLACDQVYQIHREDTSDNDAWVEMMDTRYTIWRNVGSADTPGWRIVPNGPYFGEYPKPLPRAY